MSQKLYEENSVKAIADAIRAKNGTTTTYKVSEMASAVADITDSPIMDTDLENTIQFPQMNDIVDEFITNVSYNSDDYTTTQMTNYYNKATSYSKEEPKGLVMKVPSGTTLTISDGDKTRQESASGTHTVYNIEPLKEATIAFSEKTYKVMAENGVRMIYAPSVYNVRDLGGWACDSGQIKYGKLFRGSEFTGGNTNDITAEDIARLRDWCGIKVDLDLRNNSESSSATSSPLGTGVEYFRYSIYAYAQTFSSANRITACVSALLKIMESVNAGKPVYFHCVSGADRTGTIAYILLSLLGVSQSDKDKEYELTAFTDEAGAARFRNTNYNVANGNGWYPLVKYFRDNYTGENDNEKVMAWAIANGITKDTINKFRKNMIDKKAIDTDTPTYTNILSAGLTPNTKTEVWDGKGYRNGAYASSASPYYGTDAACFCTGALTYTAGDVFYVKGATLEGSGHNRLGALTQTGCYWCKEWASLSGLAIVSKIEDGYYKIELDSSYANYANIKYIIFSAQGTADNLIITRNEPIEESSGPKLQSKIATPSTSSQTIKPDSGYDGLSEVNINAMPTATQATPTISISTAGLITASSAQTAGYVSTGTKQATKQMTTQAAKTITPSTSNQTAVAKNVYTTGAITVKGDSNLKAENIKKDVSIFGITGTLETGGSGNTSETWVFEDVIDLSEVLLGDTEKIYNISFTSNGKSYTKLRLTMVNMEDFTLYYNDTPVAGGNYESSISFRAVSDGDNYRKITFLETPDDELREFVLEYDSGAGVNAIKQPSDQAIQTDKSITITSNGSTTITPDVPYDAMSKVDITVNAGGSGGGGTFTLTINLSGEEEMEPVVTWMDAESNYTILSVNGTTVLNVSKGLLCSLISNYPLEFSTINGSYDWGDLDIMGANQDYTNMSEEISNYTYLCRINSDTQLNSATIPISVITSSSYK